jgi:hypothetical protein
VFDSVTDVILSAAKDLQFLSRLADHFSISTPRQKAMWFFTCFAAGFGSG